MPKLDPQRVRWLEHVDLPLTEATHIFGVSGTGLRHAHMRAVTSGAAPAVGARRAIPGRPGKISLFLTVSELVHMVLDLKQAKGTEGPGRPTKFGAGRCAPRSPQPKRKPAVRELLLSALCKVPDVVWTTHEMQTALEDLRGEKPSKLWSNSIDVAILELTSQGYLSRVETRKYVCTFKTRILSWFRTNPTRCVSVRELRRQVRPPDLQRDLDLLVADGQLVLRKGLYRYAGQHVDGSDVRLSLSDVAHLLGKEPDEVAEQAAKSLRVEPDALLTLADVAKLLWSTN